MRTKRQTARQYAAWLFIGASLAGGTMRADEPPFTRIQDVVYGRKHGMALTMDVFAPKAAPKGIGIIWVVSGGWFSNHDAINPNRGLSPIRELINQGYTVFAVVHGSQPRFTIPEILQDMHRSVRFIRAHAADYKIDPARIGITGGSAGGHLSLMQGTAGDNGNSSAKDPIDRVSSRVQAVACFFPPTDFLNYGKPGENALGRGVLKGFKPPFAFHTLDDKRDGVGYVPITDEQKILAIGRAISPINHATADDPPTLIIHGDNDRLVPIQQATIIVEKLKAVGVPAELVVKKGAGHGWADMGADMQTIVEWFNRQLKPATATNPRVQ